MKKFLFKFLALPFLLSGLTFLAAYGQDSAENKEGETPTDWSVRLDDPSDDFTIGSSEEDDIYFVNMEPGWHITTGPRAIFYPDDKTAEGNYTVSSQIYLFDPGDYNEAFGIFIGGENLQEDHQTYTYFLLRNSGEYLIKKRDGNETHLVKDWTETDAMDVFTDETESSVPNTLRIEVIDDEVAFFVNDQEVERLPSEEIDTDGIAGLRINHRLNVHIETFEIE